MPSAAFYPWLKALHIVFMVTWFAGLFYLPRLFIYHAEAADEPSRQRFNIMEKRLFVIMTIGAVVTAVFGIAMLWLRPAPVSQTWFHAKLLLIALLVIYHAFCKRLISALGRAAAPQPTRRLRWFNEIPAILLLGIVILAVVKP